MIKGVDISNHQAGIKPNELNVDFCIIKATEGINFVDTYCNGFVQNCINNNILWGFYHFARENNPEEEAQFFYNNCKNYFNSGIPVLDYETTNYNNKEWCERFLKKLYDLSGVWAVIYISASRCSEYANSWIPEKCGLWVAGYPLNYTNFTNDDMPYNIAPWKFCAIWQFTSSLKLKGWNLDGDIAYMDAKAWRKYAGISNTENQNTTNKKENTKSCKEIAKEVIKGKWGTGWNRKNALDSTYGEGTYEHVQYIINRGDY